MKQIDISEWGEFKVSYLFEAVSHGRRLKKSDRIEGDLPLITAGKENRGVTEYIGNTFTEIWKSPITIDMFGNSFFHDYDCYGDDNVYAFLSESLSDLSKMFIASVINAKNGENFSYTDQFRQGDADNLKIKLPARKKRAR